MIPLYRERLTLEYDEGIPRYRRGAIVPINEELIFGILTRYQVGYVPSLDVCFTEDETTFVRDTYIYKSVLPEGVTYS